ncbi:hypothetical protein AB0F72_09195 [Actinoplanes sp. NPDC023936]|uniref:hypothetical protein n=1 Tax=Actinoplanes sp. NPDC023936 TaxID=3154910 RepID=UPI0033E0D624
MTEPMSIASRVHALIFNGITRASSTATDERDWIRLSERERIAEAVYAELRAGNIEFRLGPLALLAEAVEAERKGADQRDPLPADEHHYDVSGGHRPDCRIPSHHAMEDLT